MSLWLCTPTKSLQLFFWQVAPLIGSLPFVKRSNLSRFKISIGPDAIFAETYLYLFTKSDDKDGNFEKS